MEIPFCNSSVVVRRDSDQKVASSQFDSRIVVLSLENTQPGYLERPTLASRVPLFLLGHFPTNECEISDFCV